MTADSRRLGTVYAPLNREAAALLLIDLQLGHLDAIQTLAPSLLRHNVELLTRIALLYELPIVLTGARQPPPGGTFLPEVTALLPGQAVIERTTVNAWDTPEFVAAVEKTGRRQWIVAGVALEIGVLFPALSAVTAGHSVSVVVDATGTTDARIETGALLRLALAGVALVSSASVGMELQGDVAAASGHELMALFNAASSVGPSPFDVP